MPIIQDDNSLPQISQKIIDLEIHLHSLYHNLPDDTPTLEEKYPYYLYGLENDIERMFNRE